MFGRRRSLLDYAVVAVVGTIGGIYINVPLLREIENKKKVQESSESESIETSKKS